MKRISQTAQFMFGIVFAAALMPAAPASAGLLGDDISVVFDFAGSPPNTYAHPDFYYDGVTNNPGYGVFAKPVVGASTEALAGYFGGFVFGQFAVDVGDSSIVVTMGGGTEDPSSEQALLPGIDIVLSDLDFGQDIQSVTAQQSGFLSVTGVTAHGVTLRLPSEIQIPNSDLDQFNQFSYSEEFLISAGQSQNIPEPGTLAVFAGGLVGLGVMRRRLLARRQ